MTPSHHTSPLVRQLLRHEAPTALAADFHAEQAHILLARHTNASDTPPLAAFEKGRDSPTQQHITSLIHRNTQQRTPPGGRRTQAFRASLIHPGAKDCAKAAPTPALHTYVPSRLFRAWLKYYCRLPLQNDDTQVCPRPRCTAQLDRFGDHQLVCPRKPHGGSSFVTDCHNRQVRLLMEDLNKAARQPVLEPKQPERQHTRPDIRAIGRAGGDDIIDVAITHPSASPWSRAKTIRASGSLLNTAYNTKRTKHKPIVDQAVGGAVVPIIFAASGGWEPRSHAYAKTLVRETSATAEIDSAVCKALFLQRHAICLLASTASMLTEDPPNLPLPPQLSQSPPA